MSLTYVTGDLFTQDLPAIGHGCNCSGVMGAGIAKDFKHRYPSMFVEYQRMCKDSEFRLGEIFVWREIQNGDDPGKFVYNLGTQTTPGALASLWAIRSSLNKMVSDAERRGIKKIGIPRIGAGLGGLPWRTVNNIIEKIALESNLDIVVVRRPTDM